MSLPKAIDGVAARGLARQLLNFSAASVSRRRVAGMPLRILHLLSQQPGQTGSGVSLLAIVRHASAAGHRQRAVIGIPADAPLPDVAPLSPAELFAVRFGQAPVAFPVPGMSDVMPYTSTRFSSFSLDMLEAYLQAFAAGLAAAVEDFTPDLIHSNHLWLLTALARLLFPDTPLCVSSHGTELRQLANASQLAPFVIPACASVDMVLALHADNKSKIMEAYGIAPERLRVVGAGFREDVFRPAPDREVSAGRRELIVAYAGKISAPKGVPWLIEAMRQVKVPEGRQVKLLLAGAAGGGEAETIRERAADMDNVTFLGALPQEKLAEMFRTADVFVLPSFYEGLPLVVIESLACGCLAVTTDLPGLASWMPPGLCEDGIVERVALPRLLGPDSPEPADLPRFVNDLAQALSRQLARSAEATAASDFSCRLEALSWSGVFRKIEIVYRELTGLVSTTENQL